MTHVMVDSETLGKKAGAAVLSIGAAVFDPFTGKVGGIFYRNICRDSCREAGLFEDPETVEWWMKPVRATAWARLQEDPKPLFTALAELALWWRQVQGTRLWCQGPSFDQVILDAAFAALGCEPPWRYSAGRDTRTIYDLSGIRPPIADEGRVGVYHDALDDSLTQIDYVAKGYAKILGPRGDYSIGSSIWPGLSKLVEEKGEVLQVIGKIIGARGARRHFDGSDLAVRLEEELSDVLAAMAYAIKHNGLGGATIEARARAKFEIFEEWHRENSQ